VDIHAFEVYWADLLPDEVVEKAFDKFDFEETTWFPLLNWRAGLLPRDEYPGYLMALRTVELWLLQVVMSLALEILMASQWVRSSVLDRTAADVWHYVHSLGGELAPGSPLTGASEGILDRVQGTWEQAAAVGPVHMMGHSLGSVIAYHAITRRLPSKCITRLITIGSPLEKVRFLWAKLCPPIHEWTCDWVNYLSPSDPVSGALKRFTVDHQSSARNIPLWGIGGYGQAHVGYFRDARVMRDVAHGLGACVTWPQRADGPSWLIRRVVDLAVPLLLLLIVVVGAAATALFFALVVWIAGAPLSFVVGLFSPDAAAVFTLWWRVVLGWAVGGMWVLFTTKDGYSRAAVRHARRWR
jgi:hypothetical protein